MNKHNFDNLIEIIKHRYPYCIDTKIKKQGLYLKHFSLWYKLTHIFNLLYREYVFMFPSFKEETTKYKLWFGIIYTTKPEKSPSYSVLVNRIAVEREDCFDKWSKVPLSLPIPETEAQMKYLLDKIEWLLTEEGYSVSNGYECEKWIREYPTEL